jgi:arabinosaccharide transport system substrate-binding protein
MKKEKFLSILVILGIVLGMLAGCAPAPTSAPVTAPTAPAAAAPTQPAATRVTDLSVWSFIEAHLTFFKKMAVTWNQQHPDEQVNIVPTFYPWSDIHNNLQTAMQAGKGVPDIADIEISKWSNFMNGEVQLLDLNKYVAPLEDELVTPILDVFSKDGHLYGAPSHLGATVMFYNTEQLSAAGVDYKTIVTWDDFEKALRTYKAKTGKYMTYVETYGAYQFTVLLGEQGKDLIDEKGMPQLNTPEAMKAVNLVKKWVDADIIGTIPTGNADTDEGRQAVAKGEVPALGYPLWYMSRFTDFAPDLAGKIAIAPLPVWDQTSFKSMGLGGTGTTVYKNSPNADLAARFIVWAKLSELGSATLWTDIGFDPVNKKVAQNLTVTKDPGNKFLKYFVTNPFEVLAQVQDKMFTIKTMQNTGIINDYLSATTWNRIYTSHEDPVKVMAETQKELESQSKPAN